MKRNDGRGSGRSLGIVLLAIVGVVMASGALAAEPNRPPILTCPQVAPYNCSDRAHYRFSVRYYDPDCDLPKSVQVMVDGKLFTLQAKRGKGYNTVYVSEPIAFEPGPHKYYFAAEDAQGLSCRSPRYGEWTGPYVAPDKCGKFYNSYPELSDGRVVQGEEGDIETYFTFSVHFSDYDSTPARWVKVFIDGLPHLMKLHKGMPQNGSYVYNTYLDTPPHGYYFVAQDARGAQVTSPEQGFQLGPTVYDLGNMNPELLEWSAEPRIGGAREAYTYEVYYHDLDRDPPTVIQVFIDGYPHRLKLVSGKPYDGIYSYTTNLVVSDFHGYSFRAEDGRGGETMEPMTGTIHGPVVVNQ